MDVNKPTRMECNKSAVKIEDLNSSTVSTTPKLTKKERKSLLAGRKSFEKSLKNVITNPYPVYWPYVEDTEDLFTALEVPLKKCWIPVVRLQFAAIKGKSKEERQALRHKALEDDQPNIVDARKCRSMLAIGINAVFKALERREVEAVLVANDIDPKFMAQHLIQLASQHTSVIAVPNLRQLTKSCTGAESAAVAFKTCTSCEDNLFFSAVKLIKEKALKVPKPAALPSLSAKVSVDESVVPDIEDRELQEWQEQKVSDWNLKRPHSGGKAFYPRGDEEKCKMEDAGEFIPLSKDSAFSDISDSITYLPLRIKRVQPNKDKKRAKKMKK